MVSVTPRPPTAAPEQRIRQVGVGQPARTAEPVQLVTKESPGERATPASPPQVPERAPQDAQPLEPQLGEADHVGEEGLRVPEHLVLGAEPALDEPRQPGEGEQGEEVRSEQVVRQGGPRGEEANGLGLAEGDVTLLLPGGPLEQTGRCPGRPRCR